MTAQTLRFRWTLLEALIFLAISLTATSATAQLSRARNAARRSASPPPAVAVSPVKTPEPDEPKPAPAAVSVPKPAAVSRRRPRAEPSRQAAEPRPAPLQIAKPSGRLNQARLQARRPSPKPVPVTTPVERPAPPRHRPSHSRPPPRVHHHDHCESYPLFVPSYSSHTVFVDNSVAHTPLWSYPGVPPRPVFVDDIPADQNPLPIDSHSVVEHVVLPAPVVSAPVVSPTPVVFSSPMMPWRFADFPYAQGLPGLMCRGPVKEWSGSVLFEYGSSFDGLDRRGFGAFIEHSSRVGLDVKWDSYVEDLGNGWTDELHFTDINLLFRVAQAEHYVIRAGLGANILGDAFATDGGFNVTAKLDLFPIDPLVLSAELDLGTIGDAETFHVLGKAGLMFDRFEIFGGYDYRTIGSVPLQGAMMGIQVWF